jgi:hypothetical protein
MVDVNHPGLTPTADQPLRRVRIAGRDALSKKLRRRLLGRQ